MILTNHGEKVGYGHPGLCIETNSLENCINLPLMEVGWQVAGIPVVFVSALEGKGRLSVMRQVVDTYEKWCRRLPTARLNRWLCKVRENPQILLQLVHELPHL